MPSHTMSESARRALQTLLEIDTNVEILKQEDLYHNLLRDLRIDYGLFFVGDVLLTAEDIAHHNTAGQVLAGDDRPVYRDHPRQWYYLQSGATTPTPVSPGTQLYIRTEEGIVPLLRTPRRARSAFAGDPR